MTVITTALAGGTNKGLVAQKEDNKTTKPDALEDSSGLDLLQRRALLDTGRQLADLQQRRAQKRARTDDNELDTKRHIPTLTPHIEKTIFF